MQITTVSQRSTEIQRENKKKEQAEQRRRDQEAFKKLEDERNRVQRLLNEAKAWNQSQMLRNYIAALRKTVGVNPSDEQNRWFEWAELQADQLDPMIDSSSGLSEESTQSMLNKIKSGKDL